MIKNIVVYLLIIWSCGLNCADLSLIEKSFDELTNQVLSVEKREINTLARSEFIEIRKKIQDFINLCIEHQKLNSKAEIAPNIEDQLYGFIDDAKIMKDKFLIKHKIVPPSARSLFAALQQRAEDFRYLKPQGTLGSSDLINLANDVKEFKNQQSQLFYDLRWIEIFNRLIDSLENIRLYHELPVPIENNILFKFKTIDS